MSKPRLWGGGEAVTGPVMVTPVTVPLSVILVTLVTLGLAGWLRLPWSKLPAYQIEIQEDGHAHPEFLSGAGGAAVTLHLTSLLTLTLRPEDRVDGAIALRVFLLEHGQAKPYPLHLQSTRTGTLRLRLPLARLPGLTSPGEHALLFALGRPSTALSRYVPTAAAPPPGIQVLRATLHIQPAR